MSRYKWKGCMAIGFLLLALIGSSAQAEKAVFLYDESVAAEIDLSAYLVDGTVQAPDGQGFFNWVHAGHAPEPYPSIHIPETGFEQLGTSAMKMDGVIFINHGRNLVKNKKAIVLWMVRVPAASSRMADEYGEDLTLSMWVDWNQDNMWGKSELVMRHHLNMWDQLPTTEDAMVVYYLDSFLVPDITQLVTANKKGQEKDVQHLWARAALSYDDPDSSPDGEQMYGEYEDYMLSYLVTPRMLGREE